MEIVRCRCFYFLYHESCSSSVISDTCAVVVLQVFVWSVTLEGVNPLACGAALQEVVQKAGLELKVAVVTGDDLMHR